MEQNHSAHEQKLQQAFEKLKKVKDLTPDNKWKETKKDKESGLVNHAREDPDVKLGVTRGEGVLHVDINKVIELLSNPDNRKKYIKRMKETQVLAETTQGHKINYFVMEAPMGSDRDILSIGGKFQEGDLIYMVSTSIVDDSLKGEVKGKVRAENHYQGYILKSEGDNQTRIIFISCLDIKGMIPGFIKNKMVNSKGIQGIQNIREYLVSQK